MSMSVIVTSIIGTIIGIGIIITMLLLLLLLLLLLFFLLLLLLLLLLFPLLSYINSIGLVQRPYYRAG
jgi:hypothetical protein